MQSMYKELLSNILKLSLKILYFLFDFDFIIRIYFFFLNILTSISAKYFCCFIYI